MNSASERKNEVKNDSNTGDTTPEFTPELINSAYIRDSLDMSQIMAGAIIGRLIEQRHFTRTQLFQDNGQGLYLLHKDIAAAIREVLPTIDLKEIEQMHDGTFTE